MLNYHSHLADRTDDDSDGKEVWRAATTDSDNDNAYTTLDIGTRSGKQRLGSFGHSLEIFNIGSGIRMESSLSRRI